MPGVGRKRAVALARAAWAWPPDAGPFDPTTVFGIGPVTAAVLTPLYRTSPASLPAAPHPQGGGANGGDGADGGR
jgi:hypothetical protein